MRRSRARRRALATLGVGALGATAEYFFDPVSGRRRRRVTADRTAALVRRAWRRGARRARDAEAHAEGWVRHVRHLREQPKSFDDATLAHKVETVLFRSPDVPKGQIDVNAQRGVVQLRGEVPTNEMLDELVERARSVQGVLDVENLMHLPGASAPMHS